MGGMPREGWEVNWRVEAEKGVGDQQGDGRLGKGRAKGSGRPGKKVEASRGWQPGEKKWRTGKKVEANRIWQVGGKKWRLTGGGRPQKKLFPTEGREADWV